MKNIIATVTALLSAVQLMVAIGKEVCNMMRKKKRNFKLKRGTQKKVFTKQTRGGRRF